MAYGDYNDMAELMTNLLRFVVNKVFGSLKITLNEHEIDFSKPFPKVSIIDLIKRETGVYFPSVYDSWSGEQGESELAVLGGA